MSVNSNNFFYANVNYNDISNVLSNYMNLTHNTNNSLDLSENTLSKYARGIFFSPNYNKQLFDAINWSNNLGDYKTQLNLINPFNNSILENLETEEADTVNQGPVIPSEYPEGMIAYYAPGEFDINNNIWPDRSDNNNNAVLSGSGFIESTSTNGGNTKNITSLEGTTSSSISFGDIVKNQFTICSITRYTGTTNQHRILTDPNGWTHGHHVKGVGVAYYGGWVTTQQDNVSPDTNWLVMCTTNANSKKLVNGTNVGTGNGSGNISLFINPKNSDNPWNMPASDFAIVEMAVWDRGLSETELLSVSNYMMNRLN